MTRKQSIALVLVAFMAVVAGIAFSLHRPQAPRSGNVGETPLFTIDNATSVQIGKDVSTQLVATNTARRLLRISNVSGGTTTPSDIYCSTNGRSGSLYSGLFLQGSSTIAWNTAEMYAGALNCKATNATATVTVLEQ
jgi:uncharacterized protein YpuA (DUF1002 family)